MKNLKKLTILHSNDMHGDFLAEQIDERLVGGVSLLSGYVNKVRREEKNVIYAVAGDMFRGSVIIGQALHKVCVVDHRAEGIAADGPGPHEHQVDAEAVPQNVGDEVPQRRFLIALGMGQQEKRVMMRSYFWEVALL